MPMRDPDQVDMVNWMTDSVWTPAPQNVVELLAGALANQGWTEEEIKSAFPVSRDCPLCETLPQEVRWHEAENGSTVTFAFNPDESREQLNWLNRCWTEFRDWVEVDSSLRLEEIEDFENAKIQIATRDIDGEGGVLGEAVTQVFTAQDRIHSAKLFIDSADSAPNNPTRDGTHLHEGCHVIGIPHSPGKTGLMAAVTNSVTTFGEYEQTEKLRRYPVSFA